ncbi:hypothetical protein [Bradyrhizobium sp. AZCC 1610]|uniref:hypothetical protein n=1 Tax=Bradyrhizobium sp. AZCC 1610 TaxID=3117020 RepID=UPI003FA5E39E
MMPAERGAFDAHDICAQAQSRFSPFESLRSQPANDAFENCPTAMDWSAGVRVIRAQQSHREDRAE